MRSHWTSTIDHLATPSCNQVAQSRSWTYHTILRKFKVLRYPGFGFNDLPPLMSLKAWPTIPTQPSSYSQQSRINFGPHHSRNNDTSMINLNISQCYHDKLKSTPFLILPWPWGSRSCLHGNLPWHSLSYFSLSTPILFLT